MENFKKFSAVFALIAGIVIPVLWIYFISAGVITRFHTEPTAAAFLLAAEFAASVLLLISGISLLLKKAWAQKVWLTAMGMLLYALIIASGEFLQMNHPVFGPFFIIILFATACVLLLSFLVKEGK
jgi:hypothetical protein